MFEKEAEEYAKDSFRTFVKGIREIAKIAFQKGAEFGYNKALEEATHNYNAIIADYDKRIAELAKANEWHYVDWKYIADKDYPESELSLYLVQLRNKDTLICEWETEEGFGYFWDSNLELIDNDDVYAWKEIVLPKEIKEK